MHKDAFGHLCQLLEWGRVHPGFHSLAFVLDKTAVRKLDNLTVRVSDANRKDADLLLCEFVRHLLGCAAELVAVGKKENGLVATFGRFEAVHGEAQRAFQVTAAHADGIGVDIVQVQQEAISITR